jgi:hypothetical protein
MFWRNILPPSSGYYNPEDLTLKILTSLNMKKKQNLVASSVMNFLWKNIHLNLESHSGQLRNVSKIENGICIP